MWMIFKLLHQKTGNDTLKKVCFPICICDKLTERDNTHLNASTALNCLYMELVTL